MSYSIKFEKHKNYQRFNLSGVIVEANRFGEFTIEFYEDIEQLPEVVTYVDEHDEPIIDQEFEISRTIYAGATIPAHRIPIIIEALQNKLNSYNDYLEKTDKENE
jgi:hypothetical protein